MKIRPRHLTLVLGVLLVVAGLTGCRKKNVTPPPVPPVNPLNGGYDSPYDIRVRRSRRGR